MALVQAGRMMSVPTVLGVPENGVYDSNQDPGNPAPNTFFCDAQECPDDVTVHLDSDDDGDGNFLLDIMTAIVIVKRGYKEFQNPRPNAKAVRLRLVAATPGLLRVDVGYRHSGVQR